MVAIRSFIKVQKQTTPLYFVQKEIENIIFYSVERPKKCTIEEVRVGLGKCSYVKVDRALNICLFHSQDLENVCFKSQNQPKNIWAGGW